MFVLVIAPAPPPPAGAQAPAAPVVAATLVLLALSVTGMALVVRAHGPAWSLTVFMLCASFFLWCVWGPAYAIFGELFPPAVLGKAFGLYNSTCFIGAIAGPLVTGIIKDLTGSFATGLFAAGALCLVSVLTVLALRPAFRLEPGPSLAAR